MRAGRHAANFGARARRTLSRFRRRRRRPSLAKLSLSRVARGASARPTAPPSITTISRPAEEGTDRARAANRRVAGAPRWSLPRPGSATFGGLESARRGKAGHRGEGRAARARCLPAAGGHRTGWSFCTAEGEVGRYQVTDRSSDRTARSPRTWSVSRAAACRATNIQMSPARSVTDAVKHRRCCMASYSAPDSQSNGKLCLLLC